MDEERNSFKILDSDKLKSYEALVFAQFARCLWIGSLDRTNGGKVMIQDEKGNVKEIVRINIDDAFKNSVNMLHALMSKKMRKVQREKIEKLKTTDYEETLTKAKALANYIHTTPLFGVKEATVIMGNTNYENSRDKNQE